MRKLMEPPTTAEFKHHVKDEDEFTVPGVKASMHDIRGEMISESIDWLYR